MRLIKYTWKIIYLLNMKSLSIITLRDQRKGIIVPNYFLPFCRMIVPDSYTLIFITGNSRYCL